MASRDICLYQIRYRPRAGRLDVGQHGLLDFGPDLRGWIWRDQFVENRNAWLKSLAPKAKR